MWLFVIFIGTVNGQNLLGTSHAYLDGALAGFDPFYMNMFQQPDPGRRSQLFQALNSQSCATESRVVVNSFIEESKTTKCLPDFTLQKLINYHNYREYAASASDVLHTSDAYCGRAFIRYGNDVSCVNGNNDKDSYMIQFFKETGGELVLASAKCVTHSVTIAPFESATFTPAFQTALVTLHRAATNSNAETRNKIFWEFFKFYGTHFSRRTALGARASFGKLFQRPSATVEEENFRKRCVLEAAHQTLTPGARWSNETSLMHFARASTKSCGEEEHGVIAAVTGLLPERSLEDWALAAKESPQPIFNELESLSTLFLRPWFDIVFQQMQCDVNGTALHEKFEEELLEYRSRMKSGGSNLPPPRGCGIDSNCHVGTECVSDPSATPGYRCVPINVETTSPASSLTEIPSITETILPSTTIPTQTTPLPPGWQLLNAVKGESTVLKSHLDFGRSKYSNGMSLGFRIEAQPGYKVRIRILVFETEETHDVLSIYDSNSSASRLVAQLSGSIQTPATYTSTGRAMSLTFRTDQSAIYTGFLLDYEAVL